MKNYVIVAILCLIAGGAAGYRYGANKPAKIVEKEVIKEKVVTQTKTIKQPDGTVIIEKVRVKDKEEDKKINVVVPVPQAKSEWSKWAISVDASTDFRTMRPMYGLQVQRQLIGPIMFGVRGTNNGTIGVVVGFSF